MSSGPARNAHQQAGHIVAVCLSCFQMRKSSCKTGESIYGALGVVEYIAVNPAGAWKLKLASELKAAKLPIDLNDAV